MKALILPWEFSFQIEISVAVKFICTFEEIDGSIVDGGVDQPVESVIGDSLSRVAVITVEPALALAVAVKVQGPSTRVPVSFGFISFNNQKPEVSASTLETNPKIKQIIRNIPFFIFPRP